MGAHFFIESPENSFNWPIAYLFKFRLTLGLLNYVPRIWFMIVRIGWIMLKNMRTPKSPWLHSTKVYLFPSHGYMGLSHLVFQGPSLIEVLPSWSCTIWNFQGWSWLLSKERKSPEKGKGPVLFLSPEVTCGTLHWSELVARPCLTSEILEG